MRQFETYFDENTKIWSGEALSRYYAKDCAIGRILFEEMRRNPKLICQISDTDQTQLTNEEVLRQAIRVANYLKSLHLKQTDIVALAARNTTYVAGVILACFFSGIALHAISPNQDETTFRHLLQITKPKVIFCDSIEYVKMKSASSELVVEIVTMERRIEHVTMVLDLLKPCENEDSFEPAKLENGCDQTLAILCSSGSTGMPKAVTISNTTRIYDIARFLTSEDVIFMTSTLDWVSGLMLILASTVYGTTRIISEKPFSPEYFLHIVERYNVTFVLLSPSYMALLAQCPQTSAKKLNSLKYLFYGGGKSSTQTQCKIQSFLSNGTAIFCYGFTEFNQIMTANFKGTAKPNSSGRILPGFKLKIIDKNGQHLGAGKVGEICCYHGENWLGYYQNIEATKAMFDDERWFHTGDLGYMDQDMCLYVVDRMKDTLKYRGAQYWPNEIEQLVTELPGVLDVCVFGVWNEQDGDAAAAAVVKTAESRLVAQDILNYVAAKTTSQFKHLHAGAIIVNELPKLSSGKIDRKAVKELYERLRGDDQN